MTMPIDNVDDTAFGANAKSGYLKAPAKSRTCGYCGYDLRGLPTDRCPECGRRCDSCRELHHPTSLSNRLLFWLFFGPPVAGIAATVILSGIGSAGADNSVMNVLSVLKFVTVVTSCLVSSLILGGEVVARSRRSFLGYYSESVVVQLLAGLAFLASSAGIFMVQLLIASIGIILRALA